MARLYYGQSAMSGIVSNLGEVNRALYREALEVEGRARDNLTAARASTTHTKIDPSTSPARATRILPVETAPGKYDQDYVVIMEGNNPMATEFGHGASGFFDPEKYGRQTKSPWGLYILTRAAGFGTNNVVASQSRRVGKR